MELIGAHMIEPKCSSRRDRVKHATWYRNGIRAVTKLSEICRPGIHCPVRQPMNDRPTEQILCDPTLNHVEGANVPAGIVTDSVLRCAQTRTSVSNRRSAFTLIELLIAVTIFAAIALAISGIMSRTSEGIVNNSRQATQNANARMALDYIAREFAQSIAATNITFQSKPDSSTYDSSYQCDELQFATFHNILPPTNTPSFREVIRVAYYVCPTKNYFSLHRAYKDIDSGSYGTVGSMSSMENSAELIRYVVEFRAVCHDTNWSASALMPTTEEHRLPVFIDLYLSVISETDAKRATAPGVDTVAYINRNAKRYHTRCYSLNRTALIEGR
jgi:prepilin-type N-terminal cleavage/methylation domain-containing protein